MSMKKIIPFVTSVLLFLVLSYAYHSPLLEGKQLTQHDNATFRGMAEEKVEFEKETGEVTLWTNSMFGGMPVYLIGVDYKGNFIKYVNKVIQIGARPGSYTFITMLGFFIALLLFRVNPWLAMTGGIAFGLSSYNIIILAAGHNSKAVAIAYIPVVIAAIYHAYRKNKLVGVSVFGLAMGLELLSGHPQITYYGFLTVLIFGVFEFIDAYKKKTLPDFFKVSVMLVVVAILSLGTHFTSLYFTQEYGKESIRGKSELTSDQGNKTSGLDKDYATAWSYGKMETFNLLIPNLYGGASGADLGTKSELYKSLRGQVQGAREIVKQAPAYWGPQPMTSGPVYIGAVIVFLFVLGLFLVKGSLKWWLLSATLLSFMLAWGHNFMFLTDLFLDYFPGYNKFRTVSMILVIAQITMPLLGFIAINKLIKGEIEKAEFMKGMKKAVGIVGGLCLFFLLFGKTIFDFSAPIDQQFGPFAEALRADRASLLISDALRSLFLVLVSAALLWFFFTEKLKKNVFFIALGVLILGDLWMVDKRYLNDDNFASKKEVREPFTPTMADKYILQDKDPNFRVFNLSVSTFNDAHTSYFHKSIGGYHGAKMRRYQELIDHHISRNNMAVLNMLNAKYFVVPTKQQGPQAQQNPGALGNAWFVNDFEIVENADSEIKAIASFNPAEKCFVDKRFENNLKGKSFSKDSTVQINLTSYAPNKLTYTSENGNEGLAVFSEIFYEHGWKAYLDGEEVPHFRVNYVLRGMVIPAGEHQIEFRFDPPMFKTGTTISAISSILLILLVIGALSFEFIKYIRKEKQP